MTWCDVEEFLWWCFVVPKYNALHVEYIAIKIFFYVVATGDPNCALPERLGTRQLGHRGSRHGLRGRVRPRDPRRRRRQDSLLCRCH